jgi:hypothetical protein
LLYASDAIAVGATRQWFTPTSTNGFLRTNYYRIVKVRASATADGAGTLAINVYLGGVLQQVVYITGSSGTKTTLVLTAGGAGNITGETADTVMFMVPPFVDFAATAVAATANWSNVAVQVVTEDITSPSNWH